MSNSFKVIVAGSRTFQDYALLSAKLDYYLQNKSDVTILCGCAQGADRLGEKYAKEHNYKVSYYPAYWEVHGKSAGYLRNLAMSEDANALVAFWDGKSKGTKHMIDIAKNKNLNVRIVCY